MGLMKDKLGGKTMATFSGLRAKTVGSEIKKEKEQKNVPSKENLNLEIIKTV